jgi:hypothetical protein
MADVKDSFSFDQNEATVLSQRLRIPHVQNDLVSDASRQLDVGGLAVDRVELGSFGGRLVHVVTANETASAYPNWGDLRLPQRSGLYPAA